MGSIPLTERKSLATTGRSAALPVIAPESVAIVKRTRMQSGVTEKWSRTRNSKDEACLPQKLLMNLKKLLLKENWAPLT